MPFRPLRNLACLLLSSAALAWQSLPPLPATPEQPVVNDYYGEKVTDNYQWLENSADPKVKEWVAAQNAHARALLEGQPLQNQILQWFKKLDQSSSPSYYDVAERAGKLFAMYFEPGHQQDMLVRFDSPNDLASKHVVVDPMKLDSSGSTAIQFYEVSPDGSKVAMSLAKGGTETGDLHFFDVATGNELPDVLPRVTVIGGGSAAWNADGSAVFYTRYPREGERPPADMNFYEQVYFHKIGTPGTDDTYVFGKELPRIAEITLSSSGDNKHRLATVENGDGGEYEHFLYNGTGSWTQISHFEDGLINGTFGDDGLYLLSRNAAPRGKIIRVAYDKPDIHNAITVIPQTDAVIQDYLADPAFVVTPQYLYVNQLVGGPTQIRIFDHTGKDLGTVPALPVSTVGRGVTIGGDRILFRNQSYVQSPAYYIYDSSTRKAAITALKQTFPINLSDIEVVRAFATSKDGTKVPLSILKRKDLKPNAQTPLILYGYGGFGISETPHPLTGLRFWFDAGGVYVFANIRGGSEFGEEWHQSGKGVHKQNVFDDFIASAEYLIHSGYTSPAKLAVFGASNGGLLMGAVLTQRPDVFRAVVSSVGIYDMLRVETGANGQFNVTEYGTIKNPADYKALRAYSPYQHVKEGTRYPAILFVVGENDPRVDPWHSRKMTAALQKDTTSGLPILLISFGAAGHGGIGSPEDQRLEMSTYRYEFIMDQLGVPWPEKATAVVVEPSFSSASHAHTSGTPERN